MIIITGAAGFIGSQIAHFYDKKQALLLVDKPEYFRSRNYFAPTTPTLWDYARDQIPDSQHKIIDREYFLKVLEKLEKLLPTEEKVELILHIGACTDTGQKDVAYLNKWNVEYSKGIWNWCAKHQVPLIYASSAATYGDGSQGFSDTHEKSLGLKPLNPYGQSKQDFDLWALQEVKKNNQPPHWYGLKFFNVYGPHEAHKGSMASTVIHFYFQIKNFGKCRLFRSHKSNIKDGEQMRDFIFIDDLIQIIEFLRTSQPASGLYNCGTGKARTFLDLAQAIFTTLHLPVNVDWIDTPELYRKAYQYFTEAEMDKLRGSGFKKPFTSLEAGVSQYVAWLEKHGSPPVDRIERTR